MNATPPPAAGRPAHLEPNPAREALRLCRVQLGYALFFSALVNLAYLAPTFYMLGVYDLVTPSGSEATLGFVTVALSLALLTLTYLDKVRSRLLLAVSVRLDKAFSARILQGALLQSGPQTRLNQKMRDFDLIRAAVSGPAALAIFDAPWTPIYLLACFYLHPAIGGLALGGAGALTALAIWNERSTRAPTRRASEASAAAYATQEAIGGSPDIVRALGMTAAFVAQFEDGRIRASIPQMDAARTQARIGGLIRFLRLLLQSIALGLGAWLAIHKQISGGAIFAASMLAARALSPIDAIVAQWRTVAQALSAYGQIKGELGAPAAFAPTLLPPPAPRLTVNQVLVATPTRDRLILQNVSFVARGGEVVGIVGPSGAGKTTLMQVLANAASPAQGNVRIDGARYTDWDAQRLGRQIGYVPQDCVLFPGSIKHNISRFDAFVGVDMAEVDRRTVAAAKLAGIHDLILSLPGGYDMALGPRGRGLSAGQQQRIALARALYGDPILFVFDEPDSALDAEGEAALRMAIDQLRANGALVIVAAHRSSLIASADLLAVMRGGRLEHFGPRQEVLEAVKAAERPRGPTLAPMAVAMGGAR